MSSLDHIVQLMQVASAFKLPSLFINSGDRVDKAAERFIIVRNDDLLQLLDDQPSLYRFARFGHHTLVELDCLIDLRKCVEIL